MARRILLIDIGSGITLQGLIPSVPLYGTQTGSVKASNGVPPYTYTLNAGVLPAGVYLDAGTGLLSGSPTEAGSFPITVKATDLSGASVQRAFNVTVIAEPLALSGAAPDGTAGVAQSYTYAVAGGVPPYTFALVDAPAGWSVPDPSEPTIDYTAESDGDISWTFRVTDAVGTSFDLVDTASFAAAPTNWYDSLFASGEVGMVVDFNDLSTLFQDTAHTTPVTAVGQPIRSVKCKRTGAFGTVNYGSATLQYDATSALYYAQGDAAFNLAFPGAVPAGLGGNALASMVTVCGYGSTSATIGMYIGPAYPTNPSNGNGLSLLQINDGGIWKAEFLQFGTGRGVTAAPSTGTFVMIGTKKSVSASYGMNIYRNGVNVGNGEVPGPGGNIVNLNMDIGRGCGTARPYYSAVVINRTLTSTEIADVSAAAL